MSSIHQNPAVRKGGRAADVETLPLEPSDAPAQLGVRPNCSILQSV
ncbi:MAG TPA: hypothetical protein VFD63_21355 [Pyrinomonadaceae bacterium]|nr:hypothetical protein [Pyrinomonadaceae bacterium]